MPFITIKTNVAISAEQEIALKTQLGKAIELVPYKNEQSLMIDVVDNARLWLRGNNQSPMVLVTVAVFANRGLHGYAKFSQKMTALLQEVLGIAPQNCYIKYENIPAWAVAGQTFSE